MRYTLLTKVLEFEARFFKQMNPDLQQTEIFHSDVHYDKNTGFEQGSKLLRCLKVFTYRNGRTFIKELK